MAFCPNCGTKSEGAKFCPNCGQVLAAQDTQHAMPAAQPVAPMPERAMEETLWEGASKELSSMASGGRFTKAKYRLTNKALYFEEGMLSTTSQQVPLWAIRDIDMKQSMTQKMRGVGTIVVHVQHSDYTGRDNVALQDIEGPGKVRDLLNQHAQTERLAHERRQQTHYYGQQR